MEPLSHFIVATAGHVDHGKSALVKVMTGTDPDRLPEEQARGITIDLGFAGLDLPGPSGSIVRLGLIDVPGHEDFVKNMVAGVGAADLALLTVAADDGWMPQTEEHLHVLLYFGVRAAVVALTKADLSSDLDRAANDVRLRLRGTPFAGAPIVPTSVVDGRGVQALQTAMVQVLADLPPPPDIGKPRLPIDRVFTVPGIGTVVTGTLLGGRLSRGQPIVVQPAGIASRIRRVQSHHQDVESSGPGRRTALNLPDIGAADVHRGDVVTLAAFGGPSTGLDVLLEISPRSTKTIRHGARVRVYYGSGHAAARVTFAKARELAPGGGTIAHLQLEQPAFVFASDRFTIRDWSEQFTLAGGIVLDTEAGRRMFRSAASARCLERRAAAPRDPVVWVGSLIEREAVVPRARLLIKSTFSDDDLAAAIAGLANAGTITVAADHLCAGPTWAALRRQAVDAIDGYHAMHSDRPGLPVAELRARLAPVVDGGRIFDALLADVCALGFIRDSGVLRRITHRPALPAALETAGSILLATLAARPFDPPSRGSLAPDPPSAQALRFLIERGDAVAVSADVILAPDSLRHAQDAVVALIRERGFATLADVRARLGSSRRVLVPLLEYFDRTGVTVRDGDRRTLRR